MQRSSRSFADIERSKEVGVLRKSLIPGDLWFEFGVKRASLKLGGDLQLEALPSAFRPGNDEASLHRESKTVNFDEFFWP